MIKIAIMDDELQQIKIISELLADFFAAEHPMLNHEVFCFTEGEALLSDLYRGFDIIFLDYNMPGYTGFEVARKIREVDKDVMLIFVTGFEQHWKAGYKVAAYRYIVKPVERDEFFADMRAVISSIADRDEPVTLRAGSSFVKIPRRDILYISTDGRGCSVCYFSADERAEKLKVKNGIKELTDKLGKSFFVSPHISYCVNLRHVKALKRKSDALYYLEMSNGDQVAVSRKKRAEVSQAIGAYMEGDMI